MRAEASFFPDVTTSFNWGDVQIWAVWNGGHASFTFRFEDGDFLAPLFDSDIPAKCLAAGGCTA
jgi:hypothetical protein